LFLTPWNARENTVRRKGRAKRDISPARYCQCSNSGHSAPHDGFFPRSVMLNYTLLSGLVLALIAFPCNSAADLLLYRKSS
jgi:hypothetical protein